jgi:predicted transcriptional regulator
MRELVEAGVVAETDGAYGLTDKGRGRVEEMR